MENTIRLDREGLFALARKWLAILGGLDADGRRDIAALMSILSDDIDYQIPFIEQPVHLIGHDAVRSFMESMQGVFRDVTYDVEAVYADVDAQTVVFEMSSSRLIMPDRTRYANRYIFRITAHDGRARVIREYLNPLPAQELSRRLKLIAD
jgi:ketosteroid isomerase-like protein